MALSLYSHAAIDFHEPEFFESVFLNFNDQNKTPPVVELAYMAQACAMLRRAEYTSFLIKWLDQNLTDSSLSRQFSQKNQTWHLSHEFSLAQALQGIAFLAGKGKTSEETPLLEIVRLARLEAKVKLICDQIRVDMTADHAPILPALLWTHLAFGWEIDRPFLKAALATITDNSEKVSFASQVLLT